MTKKKCQELNKSYQSEHNRVIEDLDSLNLKDFLPGSKLEGILVLCGAGYDNKALQNCILSKGWNFITSLKKQDPLVRMYKYGGSVGH